MISHPAGLDPEHQGLNSSEFALVGEIAVLLDGGRDLDGLDAALLCLRSHTQADACELFLATPGGQEMILVSHQGADLDAFCQRERFPAGEGFPGIVLDTGAALSTRSLPSESDFLRSRVNDLGYTSAVCVPVGCGTCIGGCLFLAWKGDPPAYPDPARASLLAALPLGAAVEATRMRILTVGGDGPESAAAALEARLRALTSAEDARVVYFPDPSPSMAGMPSPAPVPGAERPCPARQSGRTQVLGARSGWPRACLRSDCLCRARYCVPLKRGKDVWAVATVAFGREAPKPLTRQLPAALWLAEGASPPASGRQRVDRARHSEADAPKGSRLRIACFGGFDVRVEDRYLRPSDFTRSKARELLARLVLAAGKPVARDELARALWPAADPTLLPNRFHVAVSALRGAVEPRSRQGRDWLHIRCDGGRYYLDPRSPMYVDLWHFDALLREAALSELPNRASAVDLGLIEQAVCLYTGEVFGGVIDAAWAQGAARRWDERLRSALQRMAPGPGAPQPDGVTISPRVSPA